ncbi:MAG: glycerophosphodiester phosphodiesterase [Rhodocyclales bacterium GT-UBC]|nr:MAG: glycerophosphodiester phosphodiesterase [Rhodocyclales bacterium GT-UBC]
MLPTPPRWFAHRGGGSLAPENTLAGIRLAASLGYRAVEFDVMLNANGTPVLIHDETLERTTNGRGSVCAASDSYLFSLDAGNGEPVPRFVDAVALCLEYGLLANVEIKPAAGYELVTAAVVAREAARLWQGASVPPLLSSFSLLALAEARRVAPHLQYGVLFDEVPDDWAEQVARLGAVSLHCNARRLADATLAEARGIGVPVLCYTVNSVAQARTLFERGVSSIFTDRLDLFVQETSAYKGLHLPG